MCENTHSCETHMEPRNNATIWQKVLEEEMDLNEVSSRASWYRYVLRFMSNCSSGNPEDLLVLQYH
jgi:hypothetical protein